MTVLEKLKKPFDEIGMPSTTLDILVPLIQEEIQSFTPGYKISWDASSEDYPDVLYATLDATAKRVAYAWHKENKPQAWYLELLQ